MVLLALLGCGPPQAPEPEQADTAANHSYAVTNIHIQFPPPTGSPSAEEARRALELHPNSARAHAELGLALYGEGLFAEAETHLQKAGSSLEDPYARWLTRYYLAKSIVGQGRLEEVAKLYVELAQEAPDDAMRSHNYYQAAYIYRHYYNIELSGKYFQKSIDANGAHGRAAFGLASIHAHHGRYQEAERYFRVSLQNATTNEWRANCYAALGRVAEATGQYARAAGMFESALEKNPRNEGAYVGLRRVKRAMGVTPP